MLTRREWMVSLGAALALTAVPTVVSAANRLTATQLRSLARVAREKTVPRGLTAPESALVHQITASLKQGNRSQAIALWRRLVKSVQKRKARVPLQRVRLHVLRRSYLEPKPALVRATDNHLAAQAAEKKDPSPANKRRVAKALQVLEGQAPDAIDSLGYIGSAESAMGGNSEGVPPTGG